MGLSQTNVSLQYAFHTVCFLGVCVSIYALVVEFQKESDATYIPLCDFSESISCTKALTSKWSKGFGIVAPLLGEDHILNQRNPVFGVIFYTLLMITASMNSTMFANLTVWLTVLSNLASVYLATVLYLYVQSLCLVCLSTYIVNFILLILCIWRRRVLKRMRRKKRD